MRDVTLVVLNSLRIKCHIRRPLSTHEKHKFDSTTHSKLVMQVVTLRSRLFPNPYCKEAQIKQRSEIHACINRSFKGESDWSMITINLLQRSSKAQFQATQREKAQQADRVHRERSSLKKLNEQRRDVNAELIPN